MKLSIKILMFTVLFSLCILGPASSALGDETTQNETVGTEIIYIEDFEDFTVGEKPIPLPFYDFADSTSQNNVTFRVEHNNGSKMLNFNKVGTNTAKDVQCMMALPAQYNVYNVSMDVIPTYLDNKGVWIYLGGGGSYDPNFPIALRMRFFWDASGYNLLFYFNESTYQKIGVQRYSQYTLSFGLNDNSRMANITLMEKDGNVVWQDDTAYYTKTGETVQVLDTTQIRIWMTKDSFCSVYLDNITVSRARQMIQGAPIAPHTLTLTFDDAKASVYDAAYPMMRERGVVGEIGVVVNEVGNEGYMTWAQLQELYDAGWGIASHSLTHPNLATIPLADAQYEILKSKLWIEENMTGVQVLRFIQPQGSWTVAIAEYAHSVGYSITSYMINRNTFYRDDPTAQIESRLNQFKIGGSHLEFTTHSVVNNGSVYDVSPAQLEWFLNTTRDYKFITTKELKQYSYEMSQFNPTSITINDWVIKWTNNRNTRLNVQVAIDQTSGHNSYYVGYDDGSIQLPNMSYPSPELIISNGPLNDAVVYRIMDVSGNAMISGVTYAPYKTSHGSTVLALNITSVGQCTYDVYGLRNDTAYHILNDGDSIESVSASATHGSFTIESNTPYIVEVIVWDPYESMGMVFAIVPLVVIAAIIPMIMGIGKKF